MLYSTSTVYIASDLKAIFLRIYFQIMVFGGHDILNLLPTITLVF